MEPPRTPRKRKRNDKSACLSSPYFSPGKQEKVQKSLYSPDDVCEVQETNSGTNPLSLFYARSLSRMYEELDQLKPTLIQEAVAGDKWKVFVACTLLNKTSGKLALPVFWNMMELWPTPWDMSQANEELLVSMLLRLGTQSVRAKRLIALSREYMKDPPSAYDSRPSRASCPMRNSKSVSPRKREKYPSTPMSHLPGAGPYALDSYRIFCTVHDDPASTEWQRVLPSDKELIRYLKWKWAVKKHKKWSPTDGPGSQASLSYLRYLKADLLQSPIHCGQKNIAS